MLFISWLQYADEAVFHLINQGLSASWLDALMLLLRNQYTWVPLYLFLLFWFFKYSRQYFLPVLLFSIATFAITDYTSASILKPIFTRLRPCHNNLLNDRLVANCGGMYGMPSSHAANHFGLAMFWFLYASFVFRQKWNWLWVWAALICYAQVYVGVHYPGDILVGGILGSAWGLLTFKLFHFFATVVLKKTELLVQQ